jgi:arylsulfatase A-like enzyme
MVDLGTWSLTLAQFGPTTSPHGVRSAADERALYARMHEVYAGVMSHVDAQIGRIVQAVDELGLGDDTVIMVMSDNGASAEGGPHGTVNEYAFTLGSEETVSGMFDQREQLGGNRFYNPTRGAGPGPATRRSGSGSATRGSAARGRRWSSVGPTGSRIAATCARSSRTPST